MNSRRPLESLTKCCIKKSSKVKRSTHEPSPSEMSRYLVLAVSWMRLERHAIRSSSRRTSSSRTRTSKRARSRGSSTSSLGPKKMSIVASWSSMRWARVCLVMRRNPWRWLRSWPWWRIRSWRTMLRVEWCTATLQSGWARSGTTLAQ